MGNDPTSEVVISWASLASAVNPRARIVADGEPARTVHGVQRVYTDGLNGETVFAYHARVHGLKPNTRYRYEITADNDSNAAQPFSANFDRAARRAFRFTSYGDLATPNGAWVLSSPQSRFAVQTVEQFQPLFHLLNGDLLREPEPCAPARGVARFRQQQPDVGRESSVDAMPGQSRDRVQQRPAGARLVSRALYAAGERHALPGPLVQLPREPVLFVSLDADDVVWTPLRSSAARAARAGREHGPPADRHVVLRARLQQRRADALARTHAASCRA